MSARLDLDAIKARMEAATPAPWIAVTDNGRKNGIGIVGQVAKRGTGQAIAVFAEPDTARRNADAEFTAHAREDMPALIAEVERLRAACESGDASVPLTAIPEEAESAVRRMTEPGS